MVAAALRQLDLVGRGAGPSACAADALGPIAPGEREAALIQKPFTPVELAQRVRQALDEPR